MSERSIRNQGISELRHGDRTKARAMLQRAVDENPQDADGWLWLAFASDDKPSQIAALRRLAELSPHHPSLDKALAHLELTRNDLASATSPAQEPAAGQPHPSLFRPLADLPDPAASAPPVAAQQPQQTLNLSQQPQQTLNLSQQPQQQPCPRCGQPNQPDDAFCGNCAMPLKGAMPPFAMPMGAANAATNAAAQAQAQAQTPAPATGLASKPWVPIALRLAVGLIILGLVFWLVSAL